MADEIVRLTRGEVLTHALQISAEYKRINLSLTLRQMYYQFVSRGLCASGQKEYKRIGDTLTGARYDGRFPISGLEDRGRECHGGDFTRDDTDVDSGVVARSGDYVRSIPNWVIGADKWARQRTHVSVVVEKDALAGIFEQTCANVGVTWMALKGYPSVSLLWDWINSTRSAMTNHGGTCNEAVVYYFGDHDPDGLEIPESTERGIRTLMETYDRWFDFRFERVALTRDQIEQYDPPPFEAKETSARYASYVDKTGLTDAWELDALEPSVLRDIITESCLQHWDRDVFAEVQRDVATGRASLIEAMREGAVVRDALASFRASVATDPFGDEDE